MKIIFLDFDGVINHINKKEGMEITLKDKDEKYTKKFFLADIDGNNLHWICQLFKYCKEENIKIVVSSSWRFDYTVKDFEHFFNKLFNFNHFKQYKNKTLFLSLTPKNGDDRGIQILDWITEYEKNKKEKIEKYIIIDDEIDYDISQHISEKHLCRTEMSKGFLKKHLIQIKKYFSK
ncbi:HAD domain-containing protein [Fusobacterium necrophorum]|nr:HAD domain-containing protein [Fusobacterium necrophorum]